MMRKNALKFCLDRVASPSTVLGTKKPETLGYPTVKPASLCVPSFRHNTGV